MANLWKAFEDLLPKRKHLIGEVASIDETSMTSVVTLLSGENITVKGISVIVGNTCLIESGMIIQEIPTLSSYNVTIY